MALYKEHWLSVVKFCNDFAAQAASTLSITAPAFVNLDAHANISELAPTDFIGMVHYAHSESSKIITVSTGIALSTFGDPDNLRHLDIMNLLVERVKPESTIPVYALNAGVVTPVSWLVVQGDLSVDPIARDTTRSLQILTLRMLSGASGSP